MPIRKIATLLSAVALIALAAIGAGGCAAGRSAGGSTSASAARGGAGVGTTGTTGKDSADADNSGPGGPPEQDDDGEVEDYGRPADRADRLTGEAFARRYLAAATAEDGARACQMLLPGVAGSLGREYAGAGAPAYLRGDSCAAVLSKLFEHKHKQLVAEDYAFKVTAVRIEKKKEYVLMAFARYPERRFFDLERVGHAWKLNGLLDADYP